MVYPPGINIGIYPSMSEMGTNEREDTVVGLETFKQEGWKKNPAVKRIPDLNK